MFQGQHKTTFSTAQPPKTTSYNNKPPNWWTKSSTSPTNQSSTLPTLRQKKSDIFSWKRSRTKSKNINYNLISKFIRIWRIKICLPLLPSFCKGHNKGLKIKINGCIKWRLSKSKKCPNSTEMSLTFKEAVGKNCNLFIKDALICKRTKIANYSTNE